MSIPNFNLRWGPFFYFFVQYFLFTETGFPTWLFVFTPRLICSTLVSSFILHQLRHFRVYCLKIFRNFWTRLSLPNCFRTERLEKVFTSYFSFSLSIQAINFQLLNIHKMVTYIWIEVLFCFNFVLARTDVEISSLFRMSQSQPAKLTEARAKSKFQSLDINNIYQVRFVHL